MQLILPLFRLRYCIHVECGFYLCCAFRLTCLRQPYPQPAQLCSPLDSASPLKVSSSFLPLSGQPLYFYPSVGRLQFLISPSINASDSAYAFTYSTPGKTVAAAVLYENPAMGTKLLGVTGGRVESVAMAFEDSVLSFFLQL